MNLVKLGGINAQKDNTFSDLCKRDASTAKTGATETVEKEFVI